MSRGVVIAIILICALGVAITLVPRWNLFGDINIKTTAVTPKQLAGTGKLLGVKFPPSTEALGLIYQQWQDIFMCLKVRIPLNQLDALLAESPFAAAGWTQERSLQLDATDAA